MVDGWRYSSRETGMYRFLTMIRTAIEITLLTTTLAMGGEPLYRWEPVTLKGAFAARDGAGALVFKDKMWLLGGWNPGDKVHFPRICNNEVWSSPDGSKWDLVKENTFVGANFDRTLDWEGRHTAGYVVYRDRMWIVGGDVNQGHYQNDVWNSKDGRIWTHINKGLDVPWGPRVLHYTFVLNGKIWILGGQTMPGFVEDGSEEKFYRDCWNTTDGINWRKVFVQEPAWSARGMIGGSVVFQNRVWVLGGGTYDTPMTPTRQFHNDVWSSADGVNWIQHVKHADWEPRQYHDVAVYDDRMWVMEGYTKGVGNRKDVWYSTDGMHWRELPDTPWKARHAASVFVFNGSMWMVMGNNMQPDVWKLNRVKK